MKLRRRISEVRAAKARAALAGARMGASVNALEAWPQKWPLACTGIAAGVGLEWGRQTLHPWRASGMIRLVSTQVLPWAAQLAAMARGDPT